jgi:hypothetical protein
MGGVWRIKSKPGSTTGPLEPSLQHLADSDPLGDPGLAGEAVKGFQMLKYFFFQALMSNQAK